MPFGFAQKRLIGNTIDNHSALLIQEELSLIFWGDTQNCIQEQGGVAEMKANKHLDDGQQSTFQHLIHYDHVFFGI